MLNDLILRSAIEVYLLVIGSYSQLLAHEQCDATWKLFIFKMKKETMKLIINASIDTLPTTANLKMWSIINTDRCFLCGNRETVCHTLSFCKTQSEQGGYTWRYNNIVKYVTNCLDSDHFLPP